MLNDNHLSHHNSRIKTLPLDRTAQSRLAMFGIPRVLKISRASLPLRPSMKRASSGVAISMGKLFQELRRIFRTWSAAGNCAKLGQCGLTILP